ncbi:hypothetical protein BT63DRAFT_449755 [Microthyrium microscopicum]|uniref:Stc1 domain-containing protein n=1 Tax=Microthyrium microscopicum TaxID=703497 RepID=A0A6A6USL8_9PEZI|nr:hypothetical protein BT63DRAFT_449755 [Microthyrium microscopicum]
MQRCSGRCGMLLPLEDFDDDPQKRPEAGIKQGAATQSSLNECSSCGEPLPPEKFDNNSRRPSEKRKVCSRCCSKARVRYDLDERRNASMDIVKSGNVHASDAPKVREPVVFLDACRSGDLRINQYFENGKEFIGDLQQEDNQTSGPLRFQSAPHTSSGFFDTTSRGAYPSNSLRDVRGTFYPNAPPQLSLSHAGVPPESTHPSDVQNSMRNVGPLPPMNSHRIPAGPSYGAQADIPWSNAQRDPDAVLDGDARQKSEQENARPGRGGAE